MKYYFKSLDEVFTAVKDNDYDRNFASIIAMAYIFEEDETVFFENENFKGLGFLFDFLNVDQFDLSDQEFKEIIVNLSNLEDKCNIDEIKKIIY